MKTAIQELILLYIRVFKVITQKKANQMEFVFYRNIYGDEINRINCRSLWQDYRGRLYRVYELYDENFSN